MWTSILAWIFTDVNIHFRWFIYLSIQINWNEKIQPKFWQISYWILAVIHFCPLQMFRLIMRYGTYFPIRMHFLWLHTMLVASVCYIQYIHFFLHPTHHSHATLLNLFFFKFIFYINILNLHINSKSRRNSSFCYVLKCTNGSCTIWNNNNM